MWNISSYYPVKILGDRVQITDLAACQSSEILKVQYLSFKCKVTVTSPPTLYLRKVEIAKNVLKYSNQLAYLKL